MMEEMRNHRAVWRRSMALPAGVGLIIISGALVGCNNNGGGGSTGGSGSGGGATIATVNGQAVGRDQLHSTLEATAGGSALRGIILQELVLQEAKKQNLTVTDAEIEARLKEEAAKQSGPAAIEFQKAISTPGARQDYYRNQVRADISLTKLVTKDITVDEAKLKAWFEKNKAKFGKPEQVKLGLLIATTKVRADTMAAQLKSKAKTFAQLVQEQQNANDPIAKGSIAEMGEFLPVSQLTQFGPAVAEQIKKLKVNENTGALLLTPGGQKIYGIVRMAARQPAVTPEFAAMRPQLEQAYKLEQVARKDMPPGATFEQMLGQVEGMMAQQNQGRTMQRPGYLEMLSVMVQGAKQKKITDLQQAAKVEISDTSYANVAESFKPAPTPAAAGAPPVAGAPPAGNSTTPGASPAGNTTTP